MDREIEWWNDGSEAPVSIPNLDDDEEKEVIKEAPKTAREIYLVLTGIVFVALSSLIVVNTYLKGSATTIAVETTVQK